MIRQQQTYVLTALRTSTPEPRFFKVMLLRAIPATLPHGPQSSQGRQMSPVGREDGPNQPTCRYYRLRDWRQTSYGQQDTHWSPWSKYTSRSGRTRYHQSFHKYTNLGRMWSDQNRRMWHFKLHSTLGRQKKNSVSFWFHKIILLIPFTKKLINKKTPVVADETVSSICISQKKKSSLTPRKQEGKICGLEYAKKISTESR